MTTWEIALGFVGAIGGIGGLITAIAAIRQVQSSARKTDVDALDTIIETLRKGYRRLTEENEVLQSRVEVLREQNEDLQRKLVELDRDLTVWKGRYRRLCVWAVRRGWDPKRAEREEEEAELGLGDPRQAELGLGDPEMVG